MNVNKALRDARALLVVHGLTGWTVKLDNHVSRAGQCQFARRTISLSRKLIELWPEHEVRDTVLHEIAHALAGPVAGHGPAWVSIARAIGCNGQERYRVTEDTPTVPHRYIGTCPGCGRKARRHRLTKAIKLGASCGNCAPGVFNANYRLVWVDTVGARV